MVTRSQVRLGAGLQRLDRCRYGLLGAATWFAAIRGSTLGGLGNDPDESQQPERKGLSAIRCP